MLRSSFLSSGTNDAELSDHDLIDSLDSYKNEASVSASDHAATDEIWVAACLVCQRNCEMVPIVRNLIVLIKIKPDFLTLVKGMLTYNNLK